MKKKTFRACFLIQLKRVSKVFPFILSMTVLLTLGITLVIMAMSRSDAVAERKAKIKTALVGDVEDSYLGFGIVALQKLDSTRYAIEFLEMTEKEAKEKLSLGEISAYALIPDGFIESANRGEIQPITYATNNDASGVGAILMKELLDVITEILSDSQTAIYATQYFLWERQMWEKCNEKTDQLFLRLLNIILKRTDLYKLNCLGTASGLSVLSYYLTATLIFFLSLWGITCSSLFVKRNMSFTRLLKARGQGALTQIAAEYFSYLLLMLVNFFLMLAPVSILLRLLQIHIPEWGTDQFLGALLFFVKLIPVVATIGAMQFLLYELVSDMVSGILLQFLTAVCMAFLSGCMFPLNYFPESVQRLATLLPTGIAMHYTGKVLQSIWPLQELLLLLVYFVIFMGLSVVIRDKSFRNYS